MRESTLWKWMDNNRPSWLEIERFECSQPAGPGDCFVMDTRTAPALTGWLELKYCTKDDSDFRQGYIPKLRPLQPIFLRRMAARGIPSGILLRADNSFYLWRSDGSHAWANMVRSNQAIANATVKWADFPPVADIWADLKTQPL